MPAALRPQTFRSWYLGDCFAPGGAWHCDGRLAVLASAVRLKSQRSMLAKPPRESGRQRNIPDGDSKVADVIAKVSAGTWTSLPRHLGTYTVPAKTYEKHPARGKRPAELGTIPSRDYAIILSDTVDGKPFMFEPIAFEWMRANVRHEAMRVDPIRGTLWLVDNGERRALLMPITMSIELERDVCDWMTTRGVAVVA